MSHIFGLSHTFGGILEQGAGLVGAIVNNPFSSFGGDAQFVTPPGGSPGFNTPVILPPVGGGNGNGGNGVATLAGGSCGPRKRTTEICVVTDNLTGTVISTREVKHRRRRKRLATKSDIADLAALKSILGGGKALDAWIATRGGR